MKRTFLLFPALWLGTLAMGQTGIDSVQLNQLRTPSSPAFNIIGVEPNSVTRPGTPKALTTTLVSSVTDGFLRPDLAIEFSPYWLKSRPSVSYQEYIQPKFKQRFLQSSAVSLATKQNVVNGDTGTSAGIGYRVTWLSGRASAKTLDLTQSVNIENILNSIAGIIRRQNTATTVAQVEAQADSIAQLFVSGKLPMPQYATMDSATVARFFKDEAGKQFKAVLQAHPWNKDSASTLSDYLINLQSSDAFIPVVTARDLAESIKEPVGWLLNSSMALSSSFPDNRFNYSLVDRFGAWTTLSYRTNDERFEFNLMGRYMHAFRDSIGSNFDAGLSIVRTKSNFTFAIEGIYRYYNIDIVQFNGDGTTSTVNKTGDTYRLTANVNYKLSNAFSVTATVGKDYGSPLTVSEDLLTLFGMNFNLPTGQVLNL